MASMTKNQLILGEVVGDGTIKPLHCDIPGVTARQTTRKAGRVTVEERLYECANGLALGVRRGGPLHLADPEKGTWEGFVLGHQRFVISEVAGWLDEATVRRWVTALSQYRDPAIPPISGASCTA